MGWMIPHWFMDEAEIVLVLTGKERYWPLSLYQSLGHWSNSGLNPAWFYFLLKHPRSVILNKSAMSKRHNDWMKAGSLRGGLHCKHNLLGLDLVKYHIITNHCSFVFSWFPLDNSAPCPVRYSLLARYVESKKQSWIWNSLEQKAARGCSTHLCVPSVVNPQRS